MATTGERRRLIVIASVGGVLVVGFLLAKFVLFNGGGGSNSASPTSVSSLATGGGETTTTKPSSRSTETPETFDVFATKNPFEPVIIVTPTSDSTGGTGDTTPDTTPDGGGTGDTTPDTIPDTGTGGTGGTGGTTGTSTATTSVPSNDPAPGTSVALLDVYQQPDGTPKAKVQVGSTVYTVGTGEVFAVSYRVVSLDSPCGQFLFGDAPFRLCEGEEVIK